MNDKYQPVIWIVLSAIFLFSRLYNLHLLPLFSDEAYVIVRAQEVWQTGKLLGMVVSTTQPVFVWMVALSQIFPVDPVVSGRGVSIIFGLITALLLGRAAGKWIHPQAKWLAFGLTLLLPFTFFYDRTLLFETTLTGWIALSLFWPAAGLPLAILTKQTGWLGLPLAVGLHWKNKRQLFFALITVVVIPFMIWFIALGGWDEVLKVAISKTSAPLGSANIKLNFLRMN